MTRGSGTPISAEISLLQLPMSFVHETERTIANKRRRFVGRRSLDGRKYWRKLSRSSVRELRD